jgi:predicted phosphodiesterase
MIAVVSDVHGNYPALLSVLEEIDVIGCEQIISLGDVSGYYCMINQCMDALRSRNVTHLLGNHDAHLISGTRFSRSSSANRCLEYQNQVVTEENRKWLASSPLRLDSDGLSLVHGGWNDPLDEYLYDVTEEYFAGRHGRFFMSGHTHIQITKRFGEISYCNPALWGSHEMATRGLPSLFWIKAASCSSGWNMTFLPLLQRWNVRDLRRILSKPLFRIKNWRDG